MTNATWTDYYNKDYKDPFGKRITCSEWYKTHDSAKPFRDRVMKAINQLRYKSLWQDLRRMAFEKPDEVEDRVYRFVCDARLLAGMPIMSKEVFDEGWRCRNVLARKYTYALTEMWLLCWGDW
jgi:hypothetical protein